MKNIFIIFKLTLFILLVSLTGCCSNDDGFTPTLPPATQTGENTFGCYVDGNLLIPRTGTGTFNSPDHALIFWGSTDQSYNEIDVRDYKSGNGGLMDIIIPDLHTDGEGNYFIKESNCEDGVDANPTINIRVRWINESGDAYNWYCSVENSGTLTITRYDFENRIVSGTFSCAAVNQNDPDDVIEITEGRFDIKWDHLPKTFP